MNTVPSSASQRAELRNAGSLIVAVAAVFAAFSVGRGSGANAPLGNAPALPAPWIACGADAAQARQRADDAERTAQARMARYPFAPDEGMRALALLAEARDCLLLAGARSGDTPLAARAAIYRARIANDYRDHLTRVRHALELDDLPHAVDDVRYLSALFAGRDEAFSAELRTLELDARGVATNQDQP
jgi:hypothetical protein